MLYHYYNICTPYAVLLRLRVYFILLFRTVQKQILRCYIAELLQRNMFTDDESLIFRIQTVEAFRKLCTTYLRARDLTNRSISLIISAPLHGNNANDSNQRELQQIQ